MEPGGERLANEVVPGGAIPPPGAGLAASLAAPPLRLDLAALPAHWRRTVVELRCARPRGLEDGPWLEGALRGAWGHALRRLVAPAAEPFARPSAVELFFETQAMLTRRLPVPKPFVLEVDRQGGELVLRLVLFGLAGAWRQDAYRGLLLALEAGIALREGGGQRRPVEPLAADWWRTERVAVPAPPERVTLLFRTPFRLNARGPVGLRLEDLVFALVDRLSGLARWQGVAIGTDWGGWRRLAQGLDFDAVELGPVGWQRRSSLQRRELTMTGLIGRLDIVRPPERLMPLLALGATAHAGAHASFGLGRYDLLCW